MINYTHFYSYENDKSSIWFTDLLCYSFCELWWTLRQSFPYRAQSWFGWCICLCCWSTSGESSGSEWVKLSEWVKFSQWMELSELVELNPDKVVLGWSCCCWSTSSSKTSQREKSKGDNGMNRVVWLSSDGKSVNLLTHTWSYMGSRLFVCCQDGCYQQTESLPGGEDKAKEKRCYNMYNYCQDNGEVEGEKGDTVDDEARGTARVDY